MRIAVYWLLGDSRRCHKVGGNGFHVDEERDETIHLAETRDGRGDWLHGSADRRGDDCIAGSSDRVHSARARHPGNGVCVGQAVAGKRPRHDCPQTNSATNRKISSPWANMKARQTKNKHHARETRGVLI